MQTLTRKLASFPTPAAGLALAIASLGWCWESNAPLAGYAQLLAAILAALVAFVVITKFLIHPNLLLSELAHPVIGSVIPTLTMTLMVLSQMLNGVLAEYLWLFSIALHLCFLAAFSYFRVRNFNMEHMLPSWFVPPVGLVVAALTNPSSATFPLAMILLEFGVVIYLIMLPVMLYRLICCKPMHDNVKPTLAILAAPPNLCLAGYLTLVEQPSIAFALFMLSIALLMTTLVYLSFITLLQLPFSPGYAAFTFPAVIGATAIGKTASFFSDQGMPSSLVNSLQIISFSELLIASAVVCYVAVRYLRYYTQQSVVNEASA